VKGVFYIILLTKISSALKGTVCEENQRTHEDVWVMHQQ